MGDDKQREMRKTVFEGVGNFSYKAIRIIITTGNQHIKNSCIHLF